MTHEEMQDCLSEGIDQGIFIALVRDGALKFFHRYHVGVSITEEEASRGISATEYRQLSDADYSARLN